MSRLGLIALFTGLAAAPAAGQWTVTNLHPAGAASSSASAVHGQRQVGVASVDGQDHASVWAGSAASWSDLHPAGMLRSYAYGVSADQVVGTAYSNLFTWRAGLWTGSAALWVQLGTSQSNAYAAATGVQAGSAFVGANSHAGTWNGSSATWTDYSPGTTVSVIQGVGDGQMVGFFNPSATHAILWTGGPGSWVDLNPPGALVSSASALSGDQQVGAAGSSGNYESQRASLWRGTAGSHVYLHPPGATRSEARGLSNGQQVGSADFAGQTRAVYWTGTAASWVDLHALLPDGYSYSSASGIWSDGTVTHVVGAGFNTATNRSEALMWTRTLTAPCYPNCDASTGAPLLTANDFICFMNRFAAGESYANCDSSTAAPVLNINDFICFQQKFAAGCP